MDFAQAKITNINNFPVEESTDGNYNGLDICFVLDATGSMQCFIDSVKVLIKQLADESSEKIKELQADPESIRFAVVAYEDHYTDNLNLLNVVKYIDFTDKSNAISFTSKLFAAGGGDGAEAVIDGLDVAANKLSWRKETEKILYLIADALPHGKQFGGCSDDFPEGCPCKLTEDEVLPVLRKMNVALNVIQLTTEVSSMVNIYSKLINIECVDLSNIPKNQEDYSNNIFGSGALFGGFGTSNIDYGKEVNSETFSALGFNLSNASSAANFARPMPFQNQSTVMNMNISSQVKTKLSKYKN